MTHFEDSRAARLTKASLGTVIVLALGACAARRRPPSLAPGESAARARIEAWPGLFMAMDATEPPGHTNDVVVSPDGRRAAFDGLFPSTDQSLVVDLAGRDAVRWLDTGWNEMDSHDLVSTVAIADDTAAAALFNGAIHTWPLTSGGGGQKIADVGVRLTSMLFSADARRLVGIEQDPRTVYVVDVAGHSVRTIPLGAPGAPAGRFRAWGLCEDGARVAFLPEEGGLQTWSLASGELESGELLLDVRHLQSGGGISLAPSGHAELTGPEARPLARCRVGERLYPLELCEKDLVVPGLHAKVMAGDTSWKDP